MPEIFRPDDTSSGRHFPTFHCLTPRKLLRNRLPGFSSAQALHGVPAAMRRLRVVRSEDDPQLAASIKLYEFAFKRVSS
jgi:hypothetical protein